MAKQQDMNVSDSRGQKEFKEVQYVCRRQGCGNKQTLRFDLDEKPLPVTCCVKCRAGFGVELSQMMMSGAGMFPVGKSAAA